MRHSCFFLLCAFLINVISGCAPRKVMTATMQVKTEKPEFPKTDEFFKALLHQAPGTFQSILNNKENRVQIVYTQINRDANNKPEFTNYFFNYDPNSYFYPASTVKMPVAFLALQKLNELNIAGLNRNTTMITDSAFTGQTAVYNDPTAADGRPTIAHYIKKIFLVSDNDAYNRLYEFLGQEYINATLHKMGYESSQILHRLQVSMNEEQHRNTNPVTFFDTSGKIIYKKPLHSSKLVYKKRETFLGKGYYSGEKLVNEPFDFSKKNMIHLADLHTMMQAIIFPETFSEKQRFKLKEDDYNFLYRYMSMKPGESKYPQYDSSYTDAYSKFLLFGGKGAMPEGIRVFNKEGDAYGFLTDVAYITDFKHGVEFLLSATIHSNSDGIYNDNKYDYQTVGFPFLKQLGEIIYNYEKQRPKKTLPDLSRFKINYTENK